MFADFKDRRLPSKYKVVVLSPFQMSVCTGNIIFTVVLLVEGRGEARVGIGQDSREVKFKGENCNVYFAERSILLNIRKLI